MSQIEWTEKTWNPLAGCTMVSPGCTHCYAMRQAARFQKRRKYWGTTHRVNGRSVWTGRINLDEEALTIPLRTRNPTMFFVNSMSDLYHEDVPDNFIDRVWAVMRLCPQHTFQVLTKRAEPMAEYWHDIPGRTLKIIWAMAEFVGRGAPFAGKGLTTHLRDTEHFIPLPNVWLGISAEDQQRLDERVKHLRRCPAAVRFLSLEPLLGPVDIEHANLWIAPYWCNICDRHHEFPGKLDHCPNCGDDYEPGEDDACPGCGETDYEMNCPECGTSGGNGGLTHNTCAEGEISDALHEWLHWVIVGGESGPGARPCQVEWIRNIRNQCKAAGVPIFIKQLGACFSDSVDGIAGRSLKVPQEAAPLIGRRLHHPKGGDMSEWPEDLRIREMPCRK